MAREENRKIVEELLPVFEEFVKVAQKNVGMFTCFSAKDEYASMVVGDYEVVLLHGEATLEYRPNKAPWVTEKVIKMPSER